MVDTLVILSVVAGICIAGILFMLGSSQILHKLDSDVHTIEEYTLENGEKRQVIKLRSGILLYIFMKDGKPYATEGYPGVKVNDNPTRRHESGGLGADPLKDSTKTVPPPISR